MKFENTRVFNFEGALRGMRNPKESYHLSDSEFGSCHDEDLYLVVDSMVDKYFPEFGAIPNQTKEKTLDKFYASICIAMDDNDGILEYAAVGPKDLGLAQTLIRAGSEHRKFMRQIFVSVDVTAPLYWWKEFDTYKVGTVANSTSTMHKMASKPITLDCFEIDDFDDSLLLECANTSDFVSNIISRLEELRLLHLKYLNWAKEENDIEAKQQYNTIAKRYWKELIRWLPESWLQTRTVTMSYENLLAICSRGQRRFHKLNEWSGADKTEVPNFISWARKLPYAREFIFIDEIEI